MNARPIVAPLLLLLLAPVSARAQEDAEPPPRYLYLNLFLGAAWPVGNMNVYHDPGFVAGGRGEYAISPLVRVGGQLSFHSFDAERPGVADNEGVILMQAFAKALGEWGPYYPFALLGLGAYVSKERVTSGRRWDGGLQVGTGLEYPVTEHFAVNTGFSFHMVLRGGEESDYFWLEGYLGFLFRQP
jgi:opacity protein-like surface antigen